MDITGLLGLVGGASGGGGGDVESSLIRQKVYVEANLETATALQLYGFSTTITDGKIRNPSFIKTVTTDTEFDAVRVYGAPAIVGMKNHTLTFQYKKSDGTWANLSTNGMIEGTTNLYVWTTTTTASKWGDGVELKIIVA